MKTDLVTRLWALADDMSSDMTPPGVDPLVIYVRVSQGAKALREAAAEIERLRLGLEIIASDLHPCMHAIQATAQRYLDGGGP